MGDLVDKKNARRYDDCLSYTMVASKKVGAAGGAVLGGLATSASSVSALFLHHGGPHGGSQGRRQLGQWRTTSRRAAVACLLRCVPHRGVLRPAPPHPRPALAGAAAGGPGEGRQRRRPRRPGQDARGRAGGQRHGRPHGCAAAPRSAACLPAWRLSWAARGGRARCFAAVPAPPSRRHPRASRRCPLLTSLRCPPCGALSSPLLTSPHLRPCGALPAPAAVFQDGVKALVEKGYKKITPFFIPYAITNMGAAARHALCVLLCGEVASTWPCFIPHAITNMGAAS